MDDGSSPLEAGTAISSEIIFCLTQHEWASGGLKVSDRLVQVPEELVGGLAIHTNGSRYIMSNAFCEDLTNKYICLDTGKEFGDLLSLADHSRELQQSKTNLSDPLILNESFDEPGGGENLDDFDENGLEEKHVKPVFPLVDPSVKDMTQSDQYRIELRSYMHKKQFEDCADEVPNLDRPFQCKECNKTFERAHDLWGHHASFRGPAFKCNYGNCEEVFLRLPDFAVHYSAHAGVELVIPESSAEKKSLHITCPVCSTVVPGLYKLQRHKMKHDPELKYKCPACPKQFVKANTLRMHIANVHRGGSGRSQTKVDQGEEGSRAACDICGEIFSGELQVRDHKDQAHSGWRQGTNTYSLKHINGSKIDIKLDPNISLVHSSPFKESPVLKKIKEDPTQQMCPECGLDLDVGTSLSEHFDLMHPGEERLFQCSDCDPGASDHVKFLSLAGARRHYRQVHTNKPFLCWLCKENQSSDAALHAHLCSAHPDIVGRGAAGQSCVPCLHCPTVCASHDERVEHTRHAHLVESIDITTTDLEEVKTFSRIVRC